jgi:hypothetical protein
MEEVLQVSSAALGPVDDMVGRGPRRGTVAARPAAASVRMFRESRSTRVIVESQASRCTVAPATTPAYSISPPGEPTRSRSVSSVVVT